MRPRIDSVCFIVVSRLLDASLTLARVSFTSAMPLPGFTLLLSASRMVLKSEVTLSTLARMLLTFGTATLVSFSMLATVIFTALRFSLTVSLISLETSARFLTISFICLPLSSVPNAEAACVATSFTFSAMIEAAYLPFLTYTEYPLGRASLAIWR